MPLYSIEKVAGEGFLALWEITETQDELINSSAIPDDELETILKYPSARRRLEQLAVRALLNRCFTKKHYLGYEENNRPYLKNYPGDISISHADKFVCILVHESKYAGIDIEGRGRNFVPVENKIVTDYEYSYLNSKYKDDQLCIIWCAKEAIYKAMHEQKVEFSRQIEIKKFVPRKEGRLEARFIDSEYDDQDLNLNYRMINKDYAIAWVLRD
jgi:4'-phosphopantetheinyl transferase EntD